MPVELLLGGALLWIFLVGIGVLLYFYNSVPPRYLVALLFGPYVFFVVWLMLAFLVAFLGGRNHTIVEARIT